MGKTAEKEIKSQKDEIEKYTLPIPLPDDILLYKMFPNQFIGIIDGKIVAVDESLHNLRVKVKQIIPEGKDCIIDFIEQGANIYGFDF